MIRIGVLGYGGRMGRLIAEEIGAMSGCVLSGGVVREVKPEHRRADGIPVTANADEIIAASDVLIDFASAESTPDYAERTAAKGKAFMCGVTGLDTKTIDALKRAAQNAPVLYAPNTSLSLAAMKQITALAAKLLGGFDYDVAIHDEHHRMKKDSPSGTAKALGEAVTAGNGGTKQPQYSATRAGFIVGEHEVSFVGNGEIIRLHHSVTDRRIFARGAVEAALWLAKKPKGFYGMDDVLGIIDNPNN